MLMLTVVTHGAILNLKNQLEINLVNEPENFYYDSVLIAVAHDQFKNWGIEKIESFVRRNASYMI